MGAKRVSKQGVTVSTGNAIEVTNTTGSVLFSVDSTGSLNTLPNLTAKGSILTASAANTPATLAVGANGYTLVADSSTSTGLAYSPTFFAGKNACINGDFRINQRGFTSTTTNSTYGFDRFILTRGTGGTVTYSAQTFTPGTAPVTGYEAINYARLVSASQSATSDRALLQQRIEDARTFANQTVTLSFWAKASTGTPNIAVEIAQTFGTGGSPSSAVTGIGAQKFAITSSWVRYTKTITVPSVSGKTFGTDANSSFLSVGIWISAGSDYNSRTDSLGNQDITVDIWGVQAEAGSTATQFQTATGTIQGELAAAQRYYWRTSNVSNSNYDTIIPIGWGNSTTQVGYNVQNPVPMRTTPSSIDYSTTYSDYSNVDYVNEVAVTAIGFDSGASSPFVSVMTASSASGLTQFRPYTLRAKSSGTPNAYIGFSAEL